MNADTPFKSLASCRVALKGLLDRASLINQAVDLLAADGSKLGQAVVTMRMQHSIFASVERYRRSERSKMQPVAVAASSGVLEALGVPLDKIQLAVTILSCEGLRGSLAAQEAHAAALETELGSRPTQQQVDDLRQQAS